MPGSSRAELYFIVAMMALIVFVCAAAIIAFFKTYKKEMRERLERSKSKEPNDDSG